MIVKNSYPDLPVIPYKHTSIGMPYVVAFAKTLVPVYGLEVVRTAYCMFRNESGNGQFGVNNNYSGIQADCGVWTGLTGAIATCIKKDGAGDLRRFICFDEQGYKTSFDFTCKKVKERGMYIGAKGVNNSSDLVHAYFKKWVGTEETTDNIKNFTSLYNSAVKVFN